MNNPNFSFIILTHNEAQNLPQLLTSMQSLKAKTYVLDSNSTDETITICLKNNIVVANHPFHNHPTQWHHALAVFQIDTPWVICLDADQKLSSELHSLLLNFKDENYTDIDGIYFNRKNYFKGRWIKYGGYFPKYLLKMFRYDKGWSDLNENMDHKFQVAGKSLVWKNGILIEDNRKEDEISFWIDKHNRYSTLLAEEEVRRIEKTYLKPLAANLFGSPNERNAWLKRLWWKLPRYHRPFLYLIYRLIWKRGVLDGKNGIIFHFLQGFWFRLIVDIKIEEQLKKNTQPKNVVNFIMGFVFLFTLFYSINILFIGITTPGGVYVKWMDEHLNYIDLWREAMISIASFILNTLGYTVYPSELGLSVKDHSGFRIVYSCLGYGIMSCFAAFILAFPKSARAKFFCLIAGLCLIQVLNIVRLVLIALYYRSKLLYLAIDHHEFYNYFIYLIIVIVTCLWTSTPNLKRHSTKETSLLKPQN